MRIVAFIPVRGGSKSIPKKNIKEIAGKPLVHWVIDAAIQSKIFDTIYVSTDDIGIKEVVNLHPNSKNIEVIERSKQTATDTASTESAMLEFAHNYNFDHIVLIQATSPLLKAQDLKNAYDIYKEDENADSLLSVCRQEKFIWKKKGEYFIPVNYDPRQRPRRQDHEGILVENGAFYFTSKESLLSYQNRLSGNILAYEMLPETYFEIDEPTDWKIVEELLKNKNIDNKINHNLFKDIKLFLTDVDGVLTDAGMYYSENGDELKKFNTHDGMGFQLLREAGIKTGIITSEETVIVKRRAQKLKVDYLYQGKKNGGKLEAAEKICKDLDLTLDNVAYIGDDINCKELLENVGIAACPSNALEEIKSIKNILLLAKKGGEGVVREFSELFLNNSKS